MTAIEAYSSTFSADMVNLLSTVDKTWPHKSDNEINEVISGVSSLFAALASSDEVMETTELKIPKPDCEDAAMLVRKGEMLIVTAIMDDDPISACYAHKALDFLYRIIHGHVCDGKDCFDDPDMIMEANEDEER